MKKLLLILLFLGIWSKSYSQIITQTYIDRCTNVVYTFTVVPNGQSVVTFYNRSQVFTAAQFTNGTLQAWLEETYLWWSTLNPCSAAQAETTTVQQTAQQTTQAATQAATAAASTPPPSTPTTNTTPNATASTNTSAPNGGASSNTNNQSTDTNSSSSTESNQTGTGSSNDGGGSTEGGSSNSEGESQETKTEETKTEETKTEEKEVENEPAEESNESSEEKQEEESTEEDSESEESEESEEEESKEEGDDEGEEEENKDKKKKRNLAPPILAANLMTMQMLDGTWSTAASFGLSQSSLTGQETYGVNAMIWSNLKQFSLSLSKSKTHFWSEYEDVHYIVSQSGKRAISKNADGIRPKDRQNQIHHVGSTSINFMYIFGTNVVTTGYSRVYLGQNENKWKGFAGGYALTNSFIVLPESTLISPAFTFFGTKPVAFKGLPRWSFAPMTAVSLTPIQVNFNQDNIETKWNEHFTYIVGSGANLQLTQRFVFNIGVNTINNTDPIIPTTFAFTIGARLAF